MSEDQDYFSETVLNELQNHEDFQIFVLCFDDSKTIEMKNMDVFVIKYKSFNDCYDKISKIRSDAKILLVLIDTFEYTSHFNQMSQVHSIYVLQANSLERNSAKKKYSKLIDIFTDEEKLVTQLRQDIVLKFRNDLPIRISSVNEINIQESLSTMDDASLLFLWDALFIHHFIDLSVRNDMETLKKEMIDQCQLEYYDNPAYLSHINDFAKTCTPDTVIGWYTKDTFAYRLINKAFRTRNIQLICKFRYMIILLYDALKKLCKEQNSQNIGPFYRGQSLSETDLKNLQSNAGSYMLINTMVSATADKNLAYGFTISCVNPTIFEISIGNTDGNIIYPFAAIHDQSCMKDEEEILFFAGTVFHIDSVKFHNQTLWIIKITLNQKLYPVFSLLRSSVHVNQLDKDLWKSVYEKNCDYSSIVNIYHKWKGYRLPIKDILTNKIDIDLYRVLTNHGHPEKAIEYFKQLLLAEEFTDKGRIISLHFVIGDNYVRLSEYDHAFHHYAIVFSLLDDNQSLNAMLMERIGNLWSFVNRFDHAIVCYNSALEYEKLVGRIRGIDNLQRKIDNIHSKERVNKIVHSYQNPKNQMIEFHLEKSQLNGEQTSQTDCSSVEQANASYRTGINLLKNFDFCGALYAFSQTKSLYHNLILPRDTIAQMFGKLYEGMALAHIGLGNKGAALEMWKRSIDIKRGSTS